MGGLGLWCLTPLSTIFQYRLVRPTIVKKKQKKNLASLNSKWRVHDSSRWVVRISVLVHWMSEPETRISVLVHWMSEPETRISVLVHWISEPETRFSVLVHWMSEPETRISVLVHWMSEPETRISVLVHWMSEPETRFSVLVHWMSEPETRFSVLVHWMSEPERHLYYFTSWFKRFSYSDLNDTYMYNVHTCTFFLYVVMCKNCMPHNPSPTHIFFRKTSLKIMMAKLIMLLL